MAASPPVHRSRLRRILRWVGLAFGGLVALVLVAVVAALLWLESPSSEPFVHRQVSKLTSGLFAGRIEFDRLRLAGLLRVEITGARLFAPGDTVPAISFSHLQLRIRAWDLVRGRIDVPELLLDRPRVHLVFRGDTTNLALAFGPAHPVQAPLPPPSTGLPHLSIRAPEVHLRDGAFDMDGPYPMALDGLSLDGSAFGSLQDLAINVTSNALIRTPAERKLAIAVRGNYQGDRARVDRLSVQTGASTVSLAGAIAFDLSLLRTNFEQVSLVAEDLNAFIPSVQFLGVLQLHGDAALSDRKAHANLELDHSAGRVLLQATAGFGLSGAITDLVRYAAQIHVDGLAPQEVWAGLPRALVKLDLNVDGLGVPLTGTANVELDASGSRYDELLVDRLQLLGDAAGRTARIKELSVHGAGAVVHVQGTAGPAEGDLQADVRVQSLSATRALLDKGLHLALPAMAGAAVTSAHLTGAWGNPHIEATVTAPSLALGANHFEGIQAHVDMQKLLPLPLGTFEAHVSRLLLAQKKGSAITLAGHVDERAAALDLKGTFEDKPVALVVQGKRLSHRDGQEEWSLSTLRADALELSFATVQPARVGWGHGRVHIGAFVLEGGLGHIALDADLGHTGPLHGRLRLSGLDLTKLPTWLIPADLRLGGVVRLSADVSGTAAAPDVQADLRLTAGHFRDLANASLDAQARLADDRVEALVHAGVAAGLISVSLHAPWTTSLTELLGPLSDRPLDLTVTATRFPLGVIHQAAPAVASLGGEVTGQLDLRGSLNRPVVQTSWTVDQFSVGRVDSLHASLQAKLEAGAWDAKVSLADPHGVAAAATARLVLPLRDLLRNQLRLKERAVELHLELDDLALAWLPQLGIGPHDLVGHLTGTVSAQGTIRSPLVNLTLQAKGLGGAGYRNADATVDVTSSDHVTVTADASLAAQPVLHLVAVIQAATDRLEDMTLAEAAAVPWQLQAVMLPTAVGTLFPAAAPSAGETNAPFRGRLALQLFGSGTANVPTLHLHLALDETELNGQPVGVLTTDLDYRSGKAALAALFQSNTAGKLRADAVLQANLGLGALAEEGGLQSDVSLVQQRPSAWKAGLAEILKSPFQLAVDTDQFDLGLVNGLTGAIRNVGGQLTLHLHKSGPLAAPTDDGSPQLAALLTGLSGSLHLTNARFSLIGNGAFSDVALHVDGSYPSIRITQIQGKSGEGSFDGHMSLTHTGPAQFQGDLSLGVHSFPIVVDFQTRGFLTLQVDATALGSPGKIEIPELILSHGRVVVPARLPRTVQSFEPNPDFEMTDAPPRPVLPKAKDGDPLVITVDKITIPEDLIVEAPLGTKVTLGAHLTLVEDPAIATKDEPVRLTGKITIVRGTLALLKPFIVDEGSITLYPHQLEDPTVDVKAHYDGPDVTIRAALSGTIQDLRKSFTSSPAMSENEIFYYLATGERQTQPQQGDPAALQNQMADAALSALGAVAIGVVQGAVQNVLPSILTPDVITVGTDVTHQNIGTVRAGKYYWNGRLYFGGRYNPDANPQLNQNLYEGEAHFRVTTRSFIRLLVGNSGNDTLDYLYELDIPTKEQKANGVGK